MNPKEVRAKEKEAIELYNKGLSFVDVAKQLGFKSKSTTENILKRNGIQTRTRAGVKIPFNENFFEHINNEYKAYYLGFMMADGNVAERHNSQPCIRIELSNKDRYILEKFEQLLGFKDKLKYSRRNCSSLRWHSEKMFNDLNKLGVIPNKTKHEIIPKIDDKLMNHFIRGFFDGDGWITNTTSHGKRKGARKCIGFVSNRNLLEHLSLYLNSKLNTRLNKIQDRKGCAMILYSSVSDVNSIINYMYKDATIYLIRKYDACYQVYVDIERTTNQ